MKLQIVADQFYAIGAQLVKAGERKAADVAFRASAELDLLDDELQRTWGGGPFNGQEKRRSLFLELLRVIDPKAIVETGTCRATTTEYLAQIFDGPVYTCEIDPRFYYQSKKKLEKCENVHIEHSDSRQFLKKILRIGVKDPIIFYLDAHWVSDLPLPNELGLIFSDGREALALVDDFQVPFDAKYGYDSYGPTATLNLNLISFLRDKVDVFFPNTPASEETGHKRGCVVLSTPGLSERVSEIPLLRRYYWS